MKTRTGIALGLLVWSSVLTIEVPAQGRRRPTKIVETENIKHFRMPSKLLTAFWGRPIHMDAGVLLPPDFKKSERLPVCYSIHGFGGSHLSVLRSGPRLLRELTKPKSDYPRMIYVFLNARCPLGHHVFADSANNGPVGTALVEELIPALEEKYGAFGKSKGRFLTGHSSGGWASLWVQLRHPEFFGGVWSTAPDSVDFRDFTGIDVYEWKNAYADPDGKEIGLVRRNGEFVMTFKAFTEREVSRRAYGGQIASFDAVFSPKGEDGRPMPMFDRKTGLIDKAVAKTWLRGRAEITSRSEPCQFKFLGSSV
jgi:Putative esterase